MYGLLMDTTLSPNQTDPPNVLVARADEGLAHAHEQIARADEEIARAEEQLSKLEREAARHPSDHPQTRMNRSEEHTSELQSHLNLVCRLLLEKKKKYQSPSYTCNC